MNESPIANRQSPMPRVAVHLLPEARTIHISPEEAARRVIDAPALPKLGVFRWQPAGDGTYRPIYRIHEPMIKTVELASLLGLSNWTLIRLVRSGLVDGAQPSPNIILVNVASYFEHQEATKDPDFWTPAKRAAFSQAL